MVDNLVNDEFDECDEWEEDEATLVGLLVCLSEDVVEGDL